MLREELIKRLKEKNLQLGTTIWQNYRTNMHGSEPESYASIITALKIIFGLRDRRIENEEIITDGDRDSSVDAVFLNRKEKIVNFINVEGGHNSGFGYRDIKNTLQDLEDGFLDEDNDLKPLNERIREKFYKARKYAFKQDWRIKIYIVRLFKNPNNIPKSIKKRINLFRDKFDIEFELIGLDRLIMIYLDEEEKYCSEEKKWLVKFEADRLFRSEIRCITKSRPSVVIGKLKLKDLLALHKTYDDEKLDLYAKNVRENKKDSGLSDEIMRTLKTNPEDFYIYHNGITISCTHIKPNGKYGFKIYNPQVINGCQSLNAIYKAAYEEKSLPLKYIKRASILCRVFALEHPGQIEAVCQSTNTQRKIDIWDLRANDPVQKILEKILYWEGYEYKRKIPATKKQRQILITDLAQWVYSCKFENPAFAKNKKAQLFDITAQEKSIYKGKIFNETILDLVDLKKICDTGIYLKHKIRPIKNKKKKALLRHANFHILAALYKLGLNEKVYNEIIKNIEELVRTREVKDGDNFSYNKMFSKDAATWEELKNKLSI